MADKLVYGVYTENLIDIALTYASLMIKYPVLTDTDSITWKQEFVDWANEFEKKYQESERLEDSDYLECIDAFATEKICVYAMIGRKEEKLHEDRMQGKDTRHRSIGNLYAGSEPYG